MYEPIPIIIEPWQEYSRLDGGYVTTWLAPAVGTNYLLVEPERYAALVADWHRLRDTERDWLRFRNAAWKSLLAAALLALSGLLL